MKATDVTPPQHVRDREATCVHPTGAPAPEGTAWKCMFDRPETLAEVQQHYCPGCTHGIFHRLVAEVIDELDLRGRAVGVMPVGCSVLAYNYFECDVIQASHGRAPAVATGVKRSLPDRFVFTYQGDGDLASIGMSETVHAAIRGEPITVFFVNNGIYGMTGGQMAPTTLAGQKTTTSPAGRNTGLTGNPVDMCALLASIPGVAYLARAPLTSPKNLNKIRKYMKAAVRAQMEGKGFALIEALSTCPVQWHLPPRAALDYVNNEVVQQFPPGVFVDRVTANTTAPQSSGKNAPPTATTPAGGGRP